MTRQFDVEVEERESRRQLALLKALEFELVGAIEVMGGTMRGFAIKYNEWESLLTYKAVFEGRAMVAFVGADTPMNCIVKAAAMAKNNSLRWKDDIYAPSDA